MCLVWQLKPVGPFLELQYVMVVVVVVVVVVDNCIYHFKEFEHFDRKHFYNVKKHFFDSWLQPNIILWFPLPEELE